MDLAQIQDLPGYLYESVASRSELKTVGIVLLSGFFGAATCMAVQSLVSLDEVELKEKKARELEEEKEKGKLVKDWRFDVVDLEKFECIEKVPFLSKCPRKITIKAHNQVVASSKNVICFMQDKYWPRFFFPPQDVNAELIKETETKGFNSAAGITLWCDIVLNKDNDANDLTIIPSALQKMTEIHSAEFSLLKDYYYFIPAKVHTFEEEEEVYSRPRNPWIRIDCLRSSRHLAIQFHGVTIAKTHRPVVVFETGCPTRYYIMREDLKMETFEETETDIYCSYRGKQSYWSLKESHRIKEEDRLLDVPSGSVISYENPDQAYSKIKGLLCFLQEFRDLVIVLDGVPLERLEFHY